MNSIIENLRFLMLGTYPDGNIGGLALTLILSGLIGIGSLLVGIVIAATTLSSSAALRKVAKVISIVIRGLPSLVFLFWLYFLLPAALHIELTPLQSATIALSIYHGAFISEDIRGGLSSVNAGQWEAGRATGLDPRRIFICIALPQAIRAMIPALVNRYINMLLYTSVASVVGVFEFTQTAVVLSNRILVHPVEIFGFAAIVYLVLCSAIARFGRYVESRWDWAPKLLKDSVAL